MQHVPNHQPAMLCKIFKNLRELGLTTTKTLQRKCCTIMQCCHNKIRLRLPTKQVSFCCLRVISSFHRFSWLVLHPDPSGMCPGQNSGYIEVMTLVAKFHHLPLTLILSKGKWSHSLSLVVGSTSIPVKPAAQLEESGNALNK